MSLKTDLPGFPILPPVFQTSPLAPMVAGVCFYKADKPKVAELMPIV